MIISRTPFRMSFFGGGTDYPAWFREHGGAVLGATIDKYCYINVRDLPPFFEHKHRVVWSKIELSSTVGAIEHPAVRAVLQETGSDEGLEITHSADLPARSGLGTSSSFTVGLLNAMYAFKGRMVHKRDLAAEAVRIEQVVMGEAVGSQDQVWAAFGGLNRIEFKPDDTFEVSPLIVDQERRRLLRDSLMLLFTGFSRTASEVARKQIANMQNRVSHLHAMRGLVDEAGTVLQTVADPVDDFGRLMHESWMMKRELADGVSTPEVDEIYQAGRDAGALGGKLLGAGGGGFILFVVRPEHRARLSKRLEGLIQVTFDFDNGGSKIVVFEPNDFSDM